MPPAFDPTDQRFCRNPHPVLKRLRESSPLYFDERLGAFIATGYEAVRSILADRRFTQDRRYWSGYKPPTWNRAARAAPRTDPHPRHATVRRLMMLTLSRELVDGSRAYVEEVVGSLVDAVRGKPAFDLVADFSADVPAR